MSKSDYVTSGCFIIFSFTSLKYKLLLALIIPVVILWGGFNIYSYYRKFDTCVPEAEMLNPVKSTVTERFTVSLQYFFNL